MTMIKREISETRIPLIKREDTSETDMKLATLKREVTQSGSEDEREFSFEKDDDASTHLLVKAEPEVRSVDEFFSHANNSVDLFLKEMKGQDEAAAETAPEQHNTTTHISPTKPLNLKLINSSRTSLNTAHDDDSADAAMIQDIPMNPNKLKGPRAVFETPKNNKILTAVPSGDVHTPTRVKTPTRKSVFIDASPPKVVEYDQFSDEDHQSDSDDAEDDHRDGATEAKTSWKQLTPKRRSKPLPREPSTNTLDSASPHKSVQYTEEAAPIAKEHYNLTPEELAALQKMTLEEKLNAVLDSQQPELTYNDHDVYLENQKFQRTKSVVKRTSYYDDMLLNSVKKSKSGQLDDSEEAYDGLTDLYDTNVRNTKSNRSLKLHLNRSNSVQSQISIASGERVLETKRGDVESTENTEIAEPLPVSTPIKVTHSRQSSITDALSPSKVGLFLVNSVRKMVSSQDIGNDYAQTLETAPAELQAVDESVSHPKSSHLDTSDQNIGTDLDSLRSSNDDVFESATERAHNSLDDSDDLVKVIEENQRDQEDHDVIGNSTEIIEPMVLHREASSLEEGSTTLENSNDGSLAEMSKEEYQINIIPELDNDDFSLSFDKAVGGDESWAKEVKKEVEDVKMEDMSQASVHIKQEIVERVPHEEEQEERVIVKKEEKVVVKKEEEQEDHENDHEAALLIEESSQKKASSPQLLPSVLPGSLVSPPKKLTSNVSSSSSPQTEVLSIWQSQPEYQHVPKHKTTRCSSLVSSTNSVKRSSMVLKYGPILPPKINLVRSRVVSRESQNSNESADLSNDSDLLPDISGDSDFGSSFKKLGITIDELREDDSASTNDDEDVFYNSQEFITKEDRNVRNIWRSGTIRSTKELEPVEPREVTVFSDEDHEVKNVSSKVQIQTSPFKQHKQHEASVEIINNFDDTVNTSIATMELDEVSLLADLSSGNPLGEISPARMNRQLTPAKTRTSTASVSAPVDNAFVDSAPVDVAPVDTAPKRPVSLVNGERGRLFIRLNQLMKLDLPELLSRKLRFCCILDNGVHRIQTEYFQLGERIPIDKEFELIAQEDPISIVLTFKAKYDKITDTLVEVKEKETVPSKSFFGKIFKTKHVITRTKIVSRPAPFDAWDHLILQDGSFGKVVINLNQHFEDQITGTVQNFKLPLINEWNKKNNHQLYQIGVVDLTMLFLPRVSRNEILPNSIRQAVESLATLDEQKHVYYQGYLFQEGGDCKFMKRRFFKLENSYLIAHNEDTMKTRCKINLSKVVEIIYLNKGDTEELKSEMEPPVIKKERHFSDNLLTNGFKLKFANDEVIEFNAQDKFEKVEWLNYLGQVVDKNHFARQPWVKLMYEKKRSTIGV